MTAQHQSQQLGGIDFISPWLSDDEGSADDPIGPSRHALFRELVFQLLRSRYPWLLRILEAAGGQVLAGQGCVYVAMPTAPHDWIPIPELAGSLVLVPWIEPGQVAQ